MASFHCSCFLPTVLTCSVSCDLFVPLEVTFFAASLIGFAFLLARQLAIVAKSKSLLGTYLMMVIAAMTRILRGIFLLTGDATPTSPLYGVMSGLPYLWLLAAFVAVVSTWARLGYRTDKKAFQSPGTIDTLMGTIVAVFLAVGFINLFMLYPVAGDLTADTVLGASISFTCGFLIVAMMSYTGAFRNVFADTSVNRNDIAFRKMSAIHRFVPIVFSSAAVIGLLPLIMQLAGANDSALFSTLFTVLARVSELSVHALAGVILYLPDSASLRERRRSRADMSEAIRRSQPENMSSGRSSRGARAETGHSKAMLDTGGNLAGLMTSLKGGPAATPSAASPYVRVKLDVASDGVVRLSLRVGSGSGRRSSRNSSHSSNRRRRKSSSQAHGRKDSAGAVA